MSPRDGTEVKTCFICRGKVSFSTVVEKKDSCLTERSSCLTDRSSCLPERSEGRQHREVLSGDQGKVNLLKAKEMV